MVGVPGRSKGCHACRKRKIACSQERPECAICLKAGRQCPGYQRERIFVYVAPAAKESTTSQAPSRKTAERVERAEEASARAKTAKSPSSPEEVPSSVIVNVSSSSPSAWSGTSHSLAIVSQPSLAATSYRQQLFGAFLAQYGKIVKDDPRRFIHKHWLSMVPSRPQLSRALDAAATAFCTAKLGRACSDKSLLAESLRLYGRGLRELQLALWDPQLMYLDDTLGACVLLAMYEVFECPSQSRKGYLSHHDGCARLIQMRGPAAHTTGMGHSIFCSFRFMGTLESFVAKKSFLTTPAWMTGPFQNGPKGPYNLLLDLMLEAPTLMAWGDSIGQLSTPALQLASSLALLQALWDLEERLRAFYAEFEVSMPGELYWTQISGVSSPSPSLSGDNSSVNKDTAAEDDIDDLFPVYFAFPSAQVAGLLMLYWACLTMLYAGIVPVHGLVKHLSGLVDDEGLDTAYQSLLADPDTFLFKSSIASLPMLPPHDLPPLDRAMSFGNVGRNVCQSAPFCMQDDADDLGLSAMTAPLQIVRDTFARWPGFERELAWIARIQARQARRGVSIVKFLVDANEEVAAIK